MGMYEPLAHFLDGLSTDSWTASFDQIESKLGFALPPSAYKYPQWWSNESGRGHSQKEGWQSVGWKTSGVNLRSKQVRFVKTGKDHPPQSRLESREIAESDELWEKASKISGIADRKDLEVAALSCFIRHEAGRQLAQMGGTMPDFEVPPRRRIVW